METLNTSIFDRVLETGSLQEKLQLTKQLSALACDSNAPALERDAIVPTLIRLACDPVKQVRVELAKSLVNAKTLHPDVLFSIVADDEDVSLAFLAETRALDRLRALAILKVGDKSRQMVLCGRDELHGDVVTFLIENCDSDVCAALLDNETVELNSDHYRRLYVRFRDMGEITERLLSRSDLPLEVRILQAKRASSNIHQLMAERGWVPANDADTIIADSQETTLLRILSDADENQLQGLVPFLSSKNLLTPSIILRAACLGHLNVVCQAMAYLSSTPVLKVQRVMNDRAPMGLKSVYHKAGLPKNCFNIVRAAVDVANDLRDMPRRASQMRFGPQIVEYLMTRYSSISPADKSRLLDMVARLSDENTRNLARRVAGQLQQAA
jgi:uncharacterized protein (DUF2336 family)